MKSAGTFEWTVLGAGYRGIAAVGKLLDLGERPEGICLIDPNFTFTTAGSEHELFYNSPSLRFHECTHLSLLDAVNWVVQELSKMIHCIKTSVDQVFYADNAWRVGPFTSQRVILCSGNESGELAPGLLALGGELSAKKVLKLLNSALPRISSFSLVQ